MQQTELERILFGNDKGSPEFSNIYGHQTKEWVIKIGCNSNNYA